VIVVTRTVSREVAHQLGRALRAGPLRPNGSLARLMNASGFGFVPPDHLDGLSRWMERSIHASFRFVARTGQTASRDPH